MGSRADGHRDCCWRAAIIATERLPAVRDLLRRLRRWDSTSASWSRSRGPRRTRRCWSTSPELASLCGAEVTLLRVAHFHTRDERASEVEGAEGDIERAAEALRARGVPCEDAARGRRAGRGDRAGGGGARSRPHRHGDPRPRLGQACRAGQHGRARTTPQLRPAVARQGVQGDGRGGLKARPSRRLGLTLALPAGLLSERMDRLVLFDVDCTLVDAHGAGGRAMFRAIDEVLRRARRARRLQLSRAHRPRHHRRPGNALGHAPRRSLAQRLQAGASRRYAEILRADIRGRRGRGSARHAGAGPPRWPSTAASCSAC